MNGRPAGTGRRRAAARLVLLVGVPAVVLAGVAGCGQTARDTGIRVPGGDPGRGAELIRSYGCGSCHTVDGVDGADGLVGPPLTDFGRRAYIAGELPNGPDTLQRWIRDPQGVEPGTAMPDLDVTPTDARDLAAFLLGSR